MQTETQDEDGDPVLVKAYGRTGVKVSNAMASITPDGRVRVDCQNNPEFWLEFQIPKDMLGRKLC